MTESCYVYIYINSFSCFTGNKLQKKFNLCENFQFAYNWWATKTSRINLKIQKMSVSGRAHKQIISFSLELNVSCRFFLYEILQLSGSNKGYRHLQKASLLLWCWCSEQLGLSRSFIPLFFMKIFSSLILTSGT